MVVMIIIAVIMLMLSVLLTVFIIRWMTNKTQWYESLLDSIPSPISVTDMDMKWTFINKPVEQMLNVKREDMLGKHCSSWEPQSATRTIVESHALKAVNPQHFLNKWEWISK